MKSGVYQIRNTADGRAYIGSSSDMSQRWFAHRHLLRKGLHHNVALQSAWTEEGSARFVFETLELCTPERLLHAEMVWAGKRLPDDLYNSGLVRRPGYRPWHDASITVQELPIKEQDRATGAQAVSATGGTVSDDIKYLTVSQAAARLQTSDEMVRRMLRDGRLHGKRLGGKRAGWRLAASEVDRLLEPDPRPRPGPTPKRDAAVLLANVRAQADAARARGDDQAARQYDQLAAGMTAGE